MRHLAGPLRRDTATGPCVRRECGVLIGAHRAPDGSDHAEHTATPVITDDERSEIERVNRSGRTPLVFVPCAARRPCSTTPESPPRRAAHDDQFWYAFENAVSEQEAADLYEAFAVPGSGAPLFQAASANLNPWTEVKVNSKNPERGPMLIISGELDHTVPWAIANSSYKKQRRNGAVTEILQLDGRGHPLTIDSGWPEVADTALEFLARNDA